jgi:hypothetical protein
MTPTQEQELRKAFENHIEEFNNSALLEISHFAANNIFNWFLKNWPKDEVKQEPFMYVKKSTGEQFMIESFESMKKSGIDVENYTELFEKPQEENKDN